jgi:hypothetical protein
MTISGISIFQMFLLLLLSSIEGSVDYEAENFACALACAAAPGCDSSDCVDDVCEGLFWKGQLEERRFYFFKNHTCSDQLLSRLPCEAAVGIASEENWSVYVHKTTEIANASTDVVIASDFGFFIPVDGELEDGNPLAGVLQFFQSWLS